MVSRERTRHFNPEQAIDIETATGDTVRGQKVFSEDGQEFRLFCYLNLVCSDLACDSRQAATIYQKRRKVEEFQLVCLKIKHKANYFALRTKLFIKANQMTYEKLRKLRAA